MIYVLNSKGEPLMPTVRHGRVRHLLRDNKAIIVNYHPFTIQLTKERSNEIQEVALGIDTGYENVGLSATTKDQVLFECKIYGRRQSGSYLVKDIDGNIISSGISYKKLNLIEKRKGWIVDFKQS